MVYTVYVLYSKKYDKIYIGYTSDLIKRFHSHNELGTKGYTIKYRPWDVIYTEVFSNKDRCNEKGKGTKNISGKSFYKRIIKKVARWIISASWRTQVQVLSEFIPIYIGATKKQSLAIGSVLF